MDRNKVPQKIDEYYPLSMLIRHSSTIYYLEDWTATDKLRYLFIVCSGKEEIADSLTSRSTQGERSKTEISPPNLISATTHLKNIYQGIPLPMKKNATFLYSAKADKVVIRSVTPECTIVFRKYGLGPLVGRNTRIQIK